MKYFTLKEMERSSTAIANNIDNSIPKDKVLNFVWLIEKVLDPIREEYGKPIRVNQGYRSKALNDIIAGSSKTSQHMANGLSAASDITGGSKQENQIIFNVAKKLMNEGKIEFDQLIDEENLRWIHIGIKGGKQSGNRNEIAKISNGKFIKLN